MVKQSFGELKRLAREFLIDNYTTPMLVMLMASFVPAALLAPFSPGTAARLDLSVVTYLAAAFVIAVLGSLLWVGVARIHLLLARKQPVAFMELFWALRNRPDRFLQATLLLYAFLAVPAVPAAIGIAALVGMGTMGSYAVVPVAMALAVAELYLLCRFGLVYELLIDQPQLSAAEGMRASSFYMKGNKWRLFLLYVSFLGWLILGICSVGIGLLWIRPYISQVTANFYLDATGQLNKNMET